MPARGRKPPVGEPVLDRAVRLLDAFDASGRGLRLAELARRSGLSPSTALRLARRLATLGLLERAEDGTFTVGLRMLEFAARSPRGHGLRSIALPYLEELHRATGHHVLLGVRDGDEAVLVELLSPVADRSPLYPVGSRLPLAGTGVGLALLAFAPEDFRVDYTAREHRIEPEGVLVDRAALVRRIARIRADRVATIARPAGPRYASVAAPVFGRSPDPAAAVSVVGPPGELEPETVRAATIAIAGAISRRLRGDPVPPQMPTGPG
ncbi:IclR family transcriptional regulator [Pseudonocardia alni]|uniref:IclR family transcriptional regulator n=1 Tax=Pseudonocardia alni TaxID=33907 RepID=UPI00280B1CD4|nr:IclR family transcriptional regulator [Pseudonocardia alni]